MNTPFSLSPLDKALVVAKPIEEAPRARSEELEAEGNLVIECKRNGHAALVTVTRGKQSPVGIYSRSIIDLTEKFPSLVDSVRGMNIPHDTLLATEMTVGVNGIDAPGRVTSLTQSLVPRALRLQESERAKPSLTIFNVIVYKGKDVVGLPYRDRLDIVFSICAKQKVEHVSEIGILRTTFEEAKKKSIKEKWEGLVLYDANAGSAYRLDGKSDTPLRPDGCWKWKEYLESHLLKPSAYSYRSCLLLFLIPSKVYLYLF